jgi:putative transposase
MTAPRRILPGHTWFSTRRTTRRTFLLRPDEDGIAQQIYWYATAVLALKFGIELHVVQVLSSHIHEVLTDTYGNLPDFSRERNRAIANALKRHRDWPEEVFQRAPGSYVDLLTPASVVNEIAYSLVNCVEAGLVDHPDEWPGVTVSVNDIGRRTVHVERPSVYFAKNNPDWPERVSIDLVMPRMLLQVFRDADAAREAIRDRFEKALAGARSVANNMRRVMKEVLRDAAKRAAHVCSVPYTRQAQTAEPRRKHNPTLAAAGDREAFDRARAEVAQFREAYAGALERLRRGEPEPNFPVGTWRLTREFLRPRPPPHRRPAEARAGHATVTRTEEERSAPFPACASPAPVTRRDRRAFSDLRRSASSARSIVPDPAATTRGAWKD